MKKLTLFVAGLMLAGFSYAGDGGKDGKKCCKKDAAGAQKACCKKDGANTTAATGTVAPAARNGKACCKKKDGVAKAEPTTATPAPATTTAQ